MSAYVVVAERRDSPCSSWHGEIFVNPLKGLFVKRQTRAGFGGRRSVVNRDHIFIPVMIVLHVWRQLPGKDFLEEVLPGDHRRSCSNATKYYVMYSNFKGALVCFRLFFKVLKYWVLSHFSAEMKEHFKKPFWEVRRMKRKSKEESKEQDSAQKVTKILTVAGAIMKRWTSRTLDL